MPGPRDEHVFERRRRHGDALQPVAEAVDDLGDEPVRVVVLDAHDAGQDLGLHAGPVFYGNIGSAERLDFTVVGPAVNEVSRIAALCRSVAQPVLASSAFREAPGEAGDRLVSVGRYALRGAGRPQHLYTLERSRGAESQRPM